MTKKITDIFLEAIRGARPLKKNNKHYEINFEKSPKNIQQGTKTKHKLTNHSIKKEVTKKKTKDNFVMEKTNTNKKIKRGLINLDKKIDFHGSSLSEAKKIFVETIERCFIQNKRCILFITGKGIRKSMTEQQEHKLYYGKIRAEFLKWISEEEVTQKILSVEKASAKYGGDGAFVVYLRKNRN